MKQKTLTCKSCGYKLIIFEDCIDIKVCPECDSADLVIE